MCPDGGYNPPMGGYDTPGRNFDGSNLRSLHGFQGLGSLKKILQKKMLSNGTIKSKTGDILFSCTGAGYDLRWEDITLRGEILEGYRMAPSKVKLGGHIPGFPTFAVLLPCCGIAKTNPN